MGTFANFCRSVIHRPSTANQRSADHPSAVSVSTHKEGNHLLTDAIHHKLDNQRPHGSSRARVNRLKEFIHSKLKPGERISEHARATAFSAIKSRECGLFELTAANGQRLKRTQQEIELHILLQSQLQHGGTTSANTGDTIALEIGRPGRRQTRPTAKSGSAMAPGVAPDQATSSSPSQRVPSQRVPLPQVPPQRAASEPEHEVPAAGTADQTRVEPNAATGFRPAEVMENDFGTTSKVYFSQTVDMVELDNVLSQSHKCKEISSVNNNCWWRTSFAAAIMQHGTTPERLHAAFGKLQLGTEYQDDIQNVMAMTTGNAGKGMTEIFTNMTHAKLSHDLEQPSRLKIPGEEIKYDAHGNSLESAGEASCKRLVKAILLKKGHDADEVEQCVNGNAPGELHLVTSLVEALDTDLIIFNQPWTRNEMPPRWSMEESTVTICAREGSPLGRLEYEPDKKSCTRAMLRESDVCPILAIKSTHYNLLVTSGNIATCRYPIL